MWVIALIGLLAAAEPRVPPVAPVAPVAQVGPVAPVPWEITGTSSIAALPGSPPGYRVERRLFQKKERVVLRTGFAYLARSDFYTNPGLGIDLAWYPDEALGIDIVSSTIFFSDLSSAATALRRSTGLLPDSQKPIARITSGVRLAFAYGKLFIESLDTVVHLDASVPIHAGFLVTDRAPNLAGDIGLAVQASVGRHVLAWVDVAWLASFERRSNSRFASGPLATIGLGLLL